MKQKLKHILIAVVCAFLAIHATAQTVTWRSLGPSSKIETTAGDGITRVAQVKFHPQDSKTLYLVSVTGGLFISKDEGKSWQISGTDGLPQTGSASICIDHTDDRILYLGAGDPQYYGSNDFSGLYKSSDGGKTWVKKPGLGTRLVLEILMSPLNNQVLVAATNDGLWKSTDGGESWTPKITTGEFTQMIFQPSANSTVIYAATKDQFYISNNMGDNWTNVNLSNPNLTGVEEGGRIAVSKANPSIVYVNFVGSFNKDNPSASTSTPVYKITLTASNTVSTVTRVRAPGLPNLNGYSAYDRGQGNYNHAFGADPLNANILYCGGHQVWKSTDGGVTWTTKNSNLHTDYHQFVFSPYDNKKLYNVNDGGIWYTLDGSETWIAINEGLCGNESNTAAQSPLKKDLFSVGSQDNAEFLLNGKTWIANGGGDVNFKITYDYASTAYRYDYFGYRKLLPDIGGFSLNLPFVVTGNADEIEMEFTPANTEVAFVSNKDLYRTTNLSSNPPTWKRLTFNSEVFKVAISPVNANVVYIVTSGGKLLRTEDGLSATPSFMTYKTPGPTDGAAAIGLVKNDPNVVYLGCGDRIYRSGDKGATWSDVTGNLTNRTNIIKIIHDDYSTNESVYFATNKAVYYKNNTMTDWENYSIGIPTIADISRLMIYNDGTANSVLRVATRGRGTFESNLKGKPFLLREPENPTGALAGLNYKCYNGTWTRMPNFNSLTVAKAGNSTGLDLTVRNQTDNNGIIYQGFVNIPADDQYTFYLSSDKGSRFYIGDKLVVDNDGVHNASGTAQGTIGLKQGYHAITVEYFETTGTTDALTLSYSSGTISKQAIPITSYVRLADPIACSGTGYLTKKMWTGVIGNSILDIPLTTAPTVVSKLNNHFYTSQRDTVNFGEQISGLVCPPYSGAYTFYICGNEAAELYLSTDATPEKAVKIAFLSSNSGDQDYDRYPSQKSATINLAAGTQYYIELLHKGGNGDNTVSVGWTLPNGDYERPIPSIRLSPFNSATNAPIVTLTNPTNGLAILTGSNVTLNASVTPSSGVSKVEYFANGIKVGESSTAPYAVTFTPATAGTYQVIAKVTTTTSLVNVSPITQVFAVNYRIPENPAASTIVNGVNFKYLEGNFSEMPDFSKWSSVKTGKAKSFDLPTVKVKEDQFAFSFDGYINVPTDGIYTFYLNSDDGSKFYIGDTLLVNNDGGHGAREKQSIPIGLKAGKHAYRLEYFEGGGSETLSLAYSLNGVKTSVLATNLYVKGTAGSVAPYAVASVEADNVSGGTMYLVGNSFTLKAFATDLDGTISKVEFFSNGTKLGESTSSPYTLLWSNVQTGSYDITVKATDNSGLSFTSSPLLLNVSSYRNADNPGTTVQGVYYKYYTGGFSFIPDFQAQTPVRTSTTDNFNLSVRDAGTDDNFAFMYKGYINVPSDNLYTFYLTSDDGSILMIGDTVVVNNDGLHGSDNSISGRIGLKAGLHSITVKYFESGGDEVLNVEYESSTIGRTTIPNSALRRTNSSSNAPVVKLTYPGTGSTYSGPATVEMAADAFDLDGNITKVEFYSGTSLLGTALQAPYNYRWLNVATGTFTLTAKAYDNGSLITTSKPVSVTVTGTGNIAPTVSLTSPANNASFIAPATIALSANASDSDGSIAKVEFFRGTTLIGQSSSTTSPYTFSWTGVAAGTYSITAKATDNGGLSTSTTAINITVTAANVAPTVTLTSPANNASFTAPATIALSANASDSDGSIAKVEFFSGTTLIGQSSNTTSPYTFSWTGVAAGTYSITAKATDNGGLSTSTTAISVSVTGTNTAPTVVLTSPANNASFTAPATIALSANASDSDGSIAKVEFFRGTTLIGQSSSTTSPYTFGWTGVAAGTYSITAKATDNGGVSTSTTAITVTVTANASPTVSLTSPVNNATFAAPATVALSATANDADGTISKVEFYSGSTLLGQSLSTGNPYTFSWTNVAAGTYTLTAKAYDNSGNVTTTSGIAITVSGTSTCALDEATPVSSLYVIRNLWNDQNAGSSVVTDAGALKITHRQYGQPELYVIETGKTFAVTNGQVYTFKFDFQNFNTGVSGVEVGFAQGLNSSSNGPQTVQSLVTVPAGYNSSSFTTKSVSITSAFTGNVSIVFKFTWASQPTLQQIGYVKNISVCNGSTSPRVSSITTTHSIVVSPNPSKEEFVLNAEKSIEMMFITDNQGRQVYKTSQLPEGTSLEFGKDFANGLYTISVKYMDGSEETLKVLKAK
ncbi:MAG: hypothetical protein J7604_02665 [Sporocytophaga sp.]|uniref:Ig-like domain-containing protein n=1 Tax=Sporocytophaga sp. TaxID=2231183 RepID=UPI001B2AD5DA|nr:Ig-like domain-containing protein [Sporocytophaga sp.]MBO9699081.1 hypothetical protein [Sporocytophaga sp.]